MRRIRSLCAGLLLTLAVSGAAPAADVPMLLNYQGNLTDPGGAPKNGMFSMQFAVYDAETGGTPLPSGTPWSETQNVTVTDGVFNVLLGSVTPLPADIFQGGPTDAVGPLRFLHVAVDSETLSPRRRIASAAYSISSGSSGAGAGAWTYVETISLSGPTLGQPLPTDSNYFMMVFDNIVGDLHLVFFDATVTSQCYAYYQTFQSSTVIHNPTSPGRINLSYGANGLGGQMYFNRLADPAGWHATVFDLGVTSGTLAPTGVPSYGNCLMSSPIARVAFNNDSNTPSGKIHVYKLAVP